MTHKKYKKTTRNVTDRKDKRLKKHWVYIKSTGVFTKWRY